MELILIKGSGAILSLKTGREYALYDRCDMCCL